MPFPRPIHFIKSYIPPNQRLAIAAVCWIIGVVTTLNDHVIELTPVYGTSMSPTLNPNYHATGEKDVLVWSKYRPTQDLKRGDIVMYQSAFKPEGSGVKRVIALGGDTVILDRRRRPGTDEDGASKTCERTAMKGWDAMAPRVKVPYGHVWLEGDNWRQSSDSNYYGPLSKSMIVGKAISCVWPRERRGRPWEEEGKEKKAWGRTKVIEGVDRVPEAWVDLVEGVGG